MSVSFLNDKLCHLLDSRISDCRLKLASSSSKLDAMSPLATLSRGYLVGFNAENGKTLSSVDDISCGDKIKIRAKDGYIHGEVKEICKENI
jgi:exodeoxyribonuclease VII large subunit